MRSLCSSNPDHCPAAPCPDNDSADYCTDTAPFDVATYLDNDSRTNHHHHGSPLAQEEGGIMGLSLKEINRQRELFNYEYYHLYNIVKYGAKYSLRPLERQLKDVKAGADPAEYGVQARTADGKRKLWKFASCDRCIAEAVPMKGTVLRLGRNPAASLDTLSGVAPFAGDAYTKPSITVDESGAVEFAAIDEPAWDPHLYHSISSDLEDLGFPRAIQCKGTRPPARDLLELHRRHQDVSIEDFAAAVLKHCEPSQIYRPPRQHPTPPYRSEDEKEAWYSTPAAQEWLKTNSIPPIMTHTKRESFEWKNPEQSKS